MNNLIKEIINKSFNKIPYDKIGAIEKELLSYTNHLEKKLNKTKNLIFRNEPIDFNENYIPLTLSSSFFHYRVDDYLYVLDDYKYIGIIGNAGSGKTTLLKHFALSSLKLKFKIPIYIELRNFEDESFYSFEEYITNQISIENSEYIKILFQTGHFIFLFDGFDEINYLNNKNLVSSIDDFINRYNENNFIISSRPGTNIESINNLYIFQINPLNQNEIYLFIEKLNYTSTIKNNIFKNITTNENLKEILSIPLFLSLFISTYNKTNNINIDKKSIFFRNIVDSLFSNHDSISKLGYIREKISNLNKDELEKISSIIAFRMLFSNKYEISKDELYNIFDIIKRSTELKFENEKVLFDLLITINIITETDNHYSFPHILIQEYLCSIFISRLEFYDKENMYTKLFNNKQPISFSFLEFLYELDKENFTKYYIYPYLKNRNDIINFNFLDKDNILDFIEKYFLENNLYSISSLYKKLTNEYSQKNQSFDGGLFDF